MSLFSAAERRVRAAIPEGVKCRLTFSHRTRARGHTFHCRWKNRPGEINLPSFYSGFKLWWKFDFFFLSRKKYFKECRMRHAEKKAGEKRQEFCSPSWQGNKTQWDYFPPASSCCVPSTLGVIFRHHNTTKRNREAKVNPWEIHVGGFYLTFVFFWVFRVS